MSEPRPTLIPELAGLPQQQPIFSAALGSCPAKDTRATYIAQERGTNVSILQVHRGPSLEHPLICMIGSSGWVLGIRYVSSDQRPRFNAELASLLPMAQGKSVYFAYRGRSMTDGQSHPYEIGFTVVRREALNLAGQAWDAWVIDLREIGRGNNNHSSATRLWRDTRTGFLLKVALIY